MFRPTLALAVMAGVLPVLALAAVAGLTGRASAAPTGTDGPAAMNAVITVDTVAQEVNSDGDCSLQEAIFAANFDASQAIDPGNPSGPKITTGCTAGSGADTIVLAAGAVYTLSSVVADPYSPAGMAGNPAVTGTLTIQGNGARLVRGGSEDIRAFVVNEQVGLESSHAEGNLTLENLYIQGFRAKGGNGAGGGGGGLGAGGAIYVRNGGLTVVNSTFEGNTATGGNGSARNSNAGGGGGGLSSLAAGDGFSTGGGGGGARGGGGAGATNSGAGGGGTVGNGASSDTGTTGAAGGFACGGKGGDYIGNAGSAGVCTGGGGGGGAVSTNGPAGSGGAGNYGGGGGGGGHSTFSQAGIGYGGAGGSGGFGGGGGAGGSGSDDDGSGGNAGFGGGGGAAAGSAAAGAGGTFGGAASGGNGGGGAGLGGAIFNDSGTATIRNSTFFSNTVTGGLSGDGAATGEAHGGAIFALGGTLALYNVTMSANTGTPVSSGGGIYVRDTALIIRNTIVASSGPNSCVVAGGLSAGSGNLVVLNNGFPGCPGVVSTLDPGLAALTLNAPGNTPTMAIDMSSPAFDAADDLTCVADDQRGVMRPQLGGCDIGAYELVAPPPAPDVSITDPFECTDNGDDLDVQVVVSNTTGAPLPGAIVQATLPVGLSGLPGTCTFVGGSGTPTCVVGAGGMTWTGDIPTGGTVTINYQARIAASVPAGATLCIDTLFDPGNGSTASTSACAMVDLCPPTAVALHYFRAIGLAERAVLVWETAGEVDTLGFDVLRAASAQGPWTQVNRALLPAEGGAGFGARYLVRDNPGPGTWFYRLEEIGGDGKRSPLETIETRVGPGSQGPRSSCRWGRGECNARRGGSRTLSQRQ